MTININATSLKNQLDSANPQVLADMLRQIKIGSHLRAMPTQIIGAKLDGAAATNPYVVAAAQSITLPDDAKCGFILSAWARAGTGTKGPLTIETDGVADLEPGAHSIGQSATGDLLFLHTDAYTSVDVMYVPAKYDVVEATLPVIASTGVCAFPVSWANPMFILEAEALVGSVTGKCIIDPPVATQATTKHASLLLTKASMLFTIADAVTSARVKLAIAPGTDMNALLEAASNFL